MSDAQQKSTEPSKGAPAASPADEAEPNLDAIVEQMRASRAGEKTAEPAAPAKAADATPEDKPEGPASRVWAGVRKKEQQIQKEAKAVKAERERNEASQRQLAERLASLEAREKALDADPLAYLKTKGVTFDDLARRVLSDGKQSPEEATRRGMTAQETALKEIAERQARLEKLLTDRDQQTQESRYLTEYRASVKTTLADPQFALLAGYPDAEAEVFAFADGWAAKTGEVLTPADAAARLQKQFRDELSKLASNEAVRSLLQAGAHGQKPAVPSGQSPAPQRTDTSPKTLTNNLDGASSRGEPDWDAMSEDEQIAHALRVTRPGA